MLFLKQVLLNLSKIHGMPRENGKEYGVLFYYMDF